MSAQRCPGVVRVVPQRFGPPPKGVWGERLVCSGCDLYGATEGRMESYSDSRHLWWRVWARGGRVSYASK